MKETKSLKISPKVHKKVKVHTTNTDQNITEFADRALINQIRMDKVTDAKIRMERIKIALQSKKPNTNE